MEPPENQPHFTLHVALGFLLGIVIDLALLFLSITLGSALGLRRAWMFPLLKGIGLLGAGMVALRHVRESAYAQGVVIALSLAILLDAICGVMIH